MKRVVFIITITLLFFGCKSNLSIIEAKIKENLEKNCSKYMAIKTEIIDTVLTKEFESEMTKMRGDIFASNYMREIYLQQQKENEKNYENCMNKYKTCTIYYLRGDFLSIADDHMELINYYKKKIREIDSINSISAKKIRLDSLSSLIANKNKSAIGYFVVKHNYSCDSIKYEKTFDFDNNLEIIE